MHEPFAPQCGHCARFVYCFPTEGPLADWGYCLEEVGETPPSRAELQALEEAAAQGNFQPLLAQPHLYQAGDDGCGRFAPLLEHP